MLCAEKAVMKNKKVWMFVGIIVLVLILNHVFGWSSYISDMNNLEFLNSMVQENLFYAVLVYMALTIVACVVLALPGVTFAILASFRTYTIGSLVFMLPGTAMYTVGTAGLADKENRLLYIGIAAGLAVVVTALGIFLKKRYIGEETDGE